DTSPPGRTPGRACPATPGSTSRGGSLPRPRFRLRGEVGFEGRPEVEDPAADLEAADGLAGVGQPSEGLGTQPGEPGGRVLVQRDRVSGGGLRAGQCVRRQARPPSAWPLVAGSRPVAARERAVRRGGRSGTRPRSPAQRPPAARAAATAASRRGVRVGGLWY